jgi:hypothetical protein
VSADSSEIAARRYPTRARRGNSRAYDAASARLGSLVTPALDAVVEERQGGLHAAGEEWIGQVAVGQRQGDLQSADHYSEDGEPPVRAALGPRFLRSELRLVESAASTR